MKLVYTADYVRDMLNIVDYRLPKQQELTDILRARKFAPMEIALQRYADFVTGDLEAFLKYIRLSNVKGVMYSYKYYTEEEISERFKVEDGDRSLFGGPPPVETSYYGIVPGQGSYVKREYKLSNTCYSMYIAYTKFLMETIDLAHPKELRLYALVEGKVIACQLADVWLERIDLLNRARIRNMAMKLNLGRGDLSFYFYNYNPVHLAPEQMESSVSDPEMPEIQSDTEKNEPDAEPEKNDSKPETEKDQPESEKDQPERKKNRKQSPAIHTKNSIR